MNFTRRFLINIDTMYDTRLGLARVLVGEDAVNKLDMVAYRKRFTEAWAGVIGIVGWKEKWEKRGIDALKNARPTEFHTVFQRRLAAMLTEQEMSSPINRPEVTINMWPYKLTEEERRAFLDNFRLMYPGATVDIVDYSPKQLSPAYLKINWDAWYLYDWFEWIQLHATKFGATKMPLFVITPPALFSDEVTEETLATIKRDKANPFGEPAVEFMREFVTLTYVDVSLFSQAHRRPLASV